MRGDRNPYPPSQGGQGGSAPTTTVSEKDAIFERLYLSAGADNASPYARLKAVMDYWCALWFWPIERADELPTRREFLFDVGMLLGENVWRVEHVAPGQTTLLTPETDPEMRAMADEFDRLGTVNLSELRALFPRLRIADEVARRQHFFHWELEFADIFADNGGFDLIIGNPPWIKMEWNEQAVLGDRQPLFAIKKYTANEVAKVRADELKDANTYALYFSEYESMSGIQSFLNSAQNYPVLKGVATNLYKSFLPQAWMFTSVMGVSAFVHPNGVFDDPKGGRLRSEMYHRLREHFMFLNELKLFAEVDHHLQYSLNVYGKYHDIDFDSICNLYIPKTIDECYDNKQDGEAEGLKDDNGWCTKGHPDRLLKIHDSDIKLFALLFGDGELCQETKLPVIHVKQFLDVYKCTASANVTLLSLGDDLFSSNMWGEASGQMAGFITRNVHFPITPEDMVYSGPHIGVANPLFKTSRRVCKLNSDFDNIDLTTVGEDYMQRCNYLPNAYRAICYSGIPKLKSGVYYTDVYRVVMRRILNRAGERTLIACIVPPVQTY